MLIKNKKKHRHLAVVAIIFNDEGKILLTQRDEPKTHAHKKWHFPGGGIEFGEHPKQTALREVLEEVGINIELLSDDPFVHSFVFEEVNVHAVVLAYPAKYVSGKIDITKDLHTGDAKWFNSEEIDFSICLPEVEKLINKAKKYSILDT
ncbi:MAG: NUDIX hydrolase [Patescibacteria group bacterium]|nr:NUDIX hydrolase [Patescibacteria group bacterium]